MIRKLVTIFMRLNWKLYRMKRSFKSLFMRIMNSCIKDFKILRSCSIQKSKEGNIEIKNSLKKKVQTVKLSLPVTKLKHTKLEKSQNSGLSWIQLKPCSSDQIVLTKFNLSRILNTSAKFTFYQKLTLHK